jgi:hypothetical protein
LISINHSCVSGQRRDEKKVGGKRKEEKAKVAVAKREEGLEWERGAKEGVKKDSCK